MLLIKALIIIITDGSILAQALDTETTVVTSYAQNRISSSPQIQIADALYSNGSPEVELDEDELYEEEYEYGYEEYKEEYEKYEIEEETESVWQELLQNGSSFDNTGIFRVRNANGSYLRVIGNNLLSAMANINANTRAEIWSIAPAQGSPGYYTIETLGARGSNQGANANVLTASSQGNEGRVSVSDLRNDNQAQQWMIRSAGDGYVIANRQYPNLILNVDGGRPALAENPTDAVWQLGSYTRTSHFRGYVLSSNSGGIALRLGVLPQAITSQLSWEVYEIANTWNNISSNVSVDVFQIRSKQAWPATSAPTFDVTVEGFFFDNECGYWIVFGDFTPFGAPNSPTCLDHDWHSGRIRMSLGGQGKDINAPDRGECRLKDRQKVFLHEVGHALKLDHPHDAHPGWRPLSVMNQGLPSRNNDVAARPQGYDKFNLIQKWGK